MINMTMTIFEQITAENHLAKVMRDFSLTNTIKGACKSTELTAVIAFARNAVTFNNFISTITLKSSKKIN